MATVSQSEAAERRAAAQRKRPGVIVHRRTSEAPYVPAIEGTSAVDVLELLGRRDPSTESNDHPAQ
jgi:hypothetical protein